MAIDRYNEFLEMSTLDVSSLVEGDIITGQSSGAVALVCTLNNGGLAIGLIMKATAEYCVLDYNASYASMANQLLRQTDTSTGEMRRIITYTTLSSGATTTQSRTAASTTVTVSNGALFAIGMVIRIFVATNSYENVRITNIVGNTLTITRNYDNSGAKTWSTNRQILYTRVAYVDHNWSVIPDVGDSYSVEDRLSAVKISGTFGDEEVLNQDADSCVITQVNSGVDVPSITYRPSNVVIVTGDHSASEAIFRDIRDASDTGGWALHTDPTGADHFLYLDAQIVFGRRDQVLETSAVSCGEYVDTHFDNLNNSIFGYSNVSYKTVVRLGSIAGLYSAMYGTVLRAIYFDFLDAETDVSLYDSAFYGERFLWGGIRLGGVSDALNFKTVNLGIIVYGNVASSTLRDGVVIGSSMILTTDQISFERFRGITEPTDWTLFVSGDHVEALIQDAEFFTTADDVAGFFGFLFSGATKHFRDCTYVSYVQFALAARGWLFDEKSFQLSVRSNGVSLAGVQIRLLDRFGYSAFYRDSGVRLGVAVDAVSTSLSVDDYTKLQVGKTYRIDTERVLVTSASANPVTIQRAVQGTVAFDHLVDRILWVQDDYVLTDVDGMHEIYYVMTMSNYSDDAATNEITYFSPFRLILQKSGYETIDWKLPIGSGTPTSYKDDRVRLGVEMKPIRSIEQKSRL